MSSGFNPPVRKFFTTVLVIELLILSGDLLGFYSHDPDIYIGMIQFTILAMLLVVLFPIVNE